MSELTDFICFRCKHFNQDIGGCKAFENIPYEISSGENLHSEPLPEQGNNIVFEPLEKKENE